MIEGGADEGCQYLQASNSVARWIDQCVACKVFYRPSWVFDGKNWIVQSRAFSPVSHSWAQSSFGRESTRDKVLHEMWSAFINRSRRHYQDTASYVHRQTPRHSPMPIYRPPAQVVTNPISLASCYRSSYLQESTHKWTSEKNLPEISYPLRSNCCLWTYALLARILRPRVDRRWSRWTALLHRGPIPYVVWRA